MGVYLHFVGGVKFVNSEKRKVNAHSHVHVVTRLATCRHNRVCKWVIRVRSTLDVWAYFWWAAHWWWRAPARDRASAAWRGTPGCARATAPRARPRTPAAAPRADTATAPSTPARTATRPLCTPPDNYVHHFSIDYHIFTQLPICQIQFIDRVVNWMNWVFICVFLISVSDHCSVVGADMN